MSWDKPGPTAMHRCFDWTSCLQFEICIEGLISSCLDENKLLPKVLLFRTRDVAHQVEEPDYVRHRCFIWRKHFTGWWLHWVHNLLLGAHSAPKTLSPRHFVCGENCNPAHFMVRPRKTQFHPHFMVWPRKTQFHSLWPNLPELSSKMHRCLSTSKPLKLSYFQNSQKSLGVWTLQSCQRRFLSLPMS